ncbi:hypothetical protein CsSME_00027440 [Camellia sinensis var. sinensis]
MRGGFDEVSRVLETEPDRLDVLGRDDDGKYAVVEGVLQGGTGYDGIGACSKEEGMVQVVNSQQEMMNNIQIPNGAIGSFGLFTKWCGPEEGRSNINLEVLLEGVQVGPLPSGSNNRERLKLDDSVAQSRLRPNLVQSIQNNLGKYVGVSSKGNGVVDQKTSTTCKKGFVSRRV